MKKLFHLKNLEVENFIVYIIDYVSVPIITNIKIYILHIIYKLDGDTAVGDGMVVIVKNIFDDCDDDDDDVDDDDDSDEREMPVDDDNTADDVGPDIVEVGSRVNSSY